jgi:hypothetical protein
LEPWFRLENIVQEHRCYRTKHQPRRLLQTFVHAAFSIHNFDAQIMIMVLVSMIRFVHGSIGPRKGSTPPTPPNPPK